MKNLISSIKKLQPSCASIVSPHTPCGAATTCPFTRAPASSLENCYKPLRIGFDVLEVIALQLMYHDFTRVNALEFGIQYLHSLLQKAVIVGHCSLSSSPACYVNATELMGFTVDTPVHSRVVEEDAQVLP